MDKIGKITTKTPESKKDNSVSRIRKTDSSRSTSSPIDHALSLQRTIGNQAVQRLFKSGVIQAKLKIGQPGDIYEQEADRVAEQVMRMPEPPLQRQVEPEEEEETLQAKPLTEQITPLVQRQVEEEEEEALLQPKLETNAEYPIQRQVEEEEEEEILQTKVNRSQAAEVGPDLESRIQAPRGGGQPLPESVRTFFESRFGYDFSHVRVHTDAQAVDRAQILNAQAFTVGRDIVFGVGHYAPETTSGKKLLAHELTHVVQGGVGSKNLIHKKGGKTYKKSELKLLLRHIIGDEWMRQSNFKKPIQLTEGMIGLIQMVTSLSRADLKLLWTTPPKTPATVLKYIDYSLPDTVTEELMKRLEKIRIKAVVSLKLPPIKPKESAPKAPKEKAGVLKAIDERDALIKAITNALAGKVPEEKSKATEALKKSLEAYFETDQGKKVKEKALETLFSKKGLPFTLITGSAGLAALIANNTDIPSTPEIPLPDNLTLKFEFEGTFKEPKAVKLTLKFSFGGPEKEEKGRRPKVLALPMAVHTFIGRIDRKVISKWIIDLAFYEWESAGPEWEEKEKKFYRLVRDNPDSLPDTQLLATKLARNLFAMGMKNRINQLKGKGFQTNLDFDMKYKWLWNKFFELKGLAPRLAWLVDLVAPVVPYKSLGIEYVTFICGKHYPIRVKRKKK